MSNAARYVEAGRRRCGIVSRETGIEKENDGRRKHLASGRGTARIGMRGNREIWAFSNSANLLNAHITSSIAR